jgi:cysteine desulfuration protein SufE
MALPPKLAETVSEFQLADRETLLYLLLDFSDRLPDLPDDYVAARDAGLGRVHECQTPVFIFPEVREGEVTLHADVPRESPTVRGVVSVLTHGLDGASPQDIADLPDDLLHQMGIIDAVGMMRQQGLSAVLQRIKYTVREAAA